MTKYLNAEQVEALRKIDTPTICDLLEMVAPDRRGVGYTTKYLHCVFPNLPADGWPRQNREHSRQEPGSLAGDEYMQLRFKYFDCVASEHLEGVLRGLAERVKS